MKSDAAASPVIIKIGGSLLEGGQSGQLPRLDAILSLLGQSNVPIVLVPGGGAFADTVRQEQARLQLSDKTAHRMALLSMHQLALGLIDYAARTGYRRRLVVTESDTAIRQAVAVGDIAVWVPLPMTDGDPTIPEDWSITSDGLATWLARRLSARLLVVLKSVTVPAGSTADALAASGLVDPSFPGLVASAGCPWRVLGPDEYGQLTALIG